MLEQSMVVSRVERRSRFILFPFAAALHAAILATAMVAAVWNVRLPTTPPPLTELWVPAMDVGVPPPPPAAARRSEPEPAATPPPAEVVTPTTVPSETVAIDVSPRTHGTSDAGDAAGSERGVVGGAADGREDGFIGSLGSDRSGPAIGTPSTPLRPGAGVSTPANILRVEPAYPELARRLKLEGLVVIECVIARDGSVRSPRIVKSAHPLLDQAALDAVRQWRYEPGRMQGRPVDVLFTLTVNFDLK